MRAALVLVLVALTGCGGATAVDSIGSGATASAVPDGGAADASSASSSAPGAYPIACTMYRSTSPGEFAEARLDFSSDVDGTKTTTLKGRTFEGTVEAIGGAPDDFLFRISVVESQVTQEFRLRRSERPPFEFGGYHGFSGLAYVGSDTQYICIAGASASSPVGGAESVDPPLPLRARCTVNRRDGEVELLEFDGPGTQVGDGMITVSAYDDQFDGRSMTVNVRGSTIAGVGSFSQLLQLDRSRRLVNLLDAEHGFSGRVSTTLSDGRVVSYACATVP
jgi:hypothetical protein